MEECTARASFKEVTKGLGGKGLSRRKVAQGRAWTSRSALQAPYQTGFASIMAMAEAGSLSANAKRKYPGKGKGSFCDYSSARDYFSNIA
jgi:hypothetical protein